MDLNDLTRRQQKALVALMEALAFSDGRVDEGERREINKVANTLGDERYRELLEDANEEIQDEEALKRTLRSIEDPAAREVIYGTALEESMLSPSVTHHQTALLDWVGETWNMETSG